MLISLQNKQAVYFKVLENNAQDISGKSCTASLLFALMLNQNSRVVSGHNNLDKKFLQISPVYAIFF